MIEVTFNHFFVIYLTVTIAAILLIWLVRHSQKKIFFTTEKKLQQCEFCHYRYVENSSDSLSRCPQCHLYNRHDV